MTQTFLMEGKIYLKVLRYEPHSDKSLSRSRLSSFSHFFIAGTTKFPHRESLKSNQIIRPACRAHHGRKANTRPHQRVTKKLFKRQI